MCRSPPPASFSGSICSSFVPQLGDWLLVGSCGRSVFSLSVLGLAVPAARSARQAPYLRHARFLSAWNCRGFKEVGENKGILAKTRLEWSNSLRLMADL